MTNEIMNMAYKYAYFAKIITISFFYTPIFPLATALGIVALCI